MKIDLFLVPGEVPDFSTKGRRVIVIDVLRACTTLAVAVASGAERIVPVDSVEGAKQLLALLDRKTTLLAGEREGINLPGFDLGNSPLEFRGPRIRGKSIIFTTTNGAPLMARMNNTVETLLLALVNLETVVEYLHATAEPEWSIICAGQGGRFSLEDAFCGGMAVDSLLERGLDLDLNDGARAAHVLYTAHRADPAGLVRGSAHGRFLFENGMEGDVEAACALNSVPVLPVLREGRVVLGRAAGGPTPS
jgi:2-phosphosulfolactate phosphatase